MIFYFISLYSNTLWVDVLRLQIPLRKKKDSGINRNFLFPIDEKGRAYLLDYKEDVNATLCLEISLITLGCITQIQKQRYKVFRKQLYLCIKFFNVIVWNYGR
jgi:hypothetical protein